MEGGVRALLAKVGDDEKLIEEVRVYECLWKVTSMAYKDLRAKENSWKIVAEKVGNTTVMECQRRWKSLRDKYVREVKKVKKGKSGDEGPPLVSCWPLFELMTFIDDTVRHRLTATNFIACAPLPAEVEQEPENGQEEDSVADALVELAGSRETTVSREASVSGETCTPRETSTSKRTPNQKRKRPRALDDVETAILSKFGAEDECDGEEHFGLHVASILRSLPPKQRAYTKIEIDKLLFSAQFSEPYIPPPIPYPPPTLYSPSTPQHPIHSLNLPTSNSTHRL